MSVKLLNEHNLKSLSLKGGCTGSSESTLVKMPHCWKSHVTAHMFMFQWKQLLWCSLGAFGWDTSNEYPYDDKIWLSCMRRTKAQTSLCICAVWSAPLLPLPVKYNTSTYYTQNFNILASLCSRACWFEAHLVAGCKKYMEENVWTGLSDCIELCIVKLMRFRCTLYLNSILKYKFNR